MIDCILKGGRIIVSRNPLYLGQVDLGWWGEILERSQAFGSDQLSRAGADDHDVETQIAAQPRLTAQELRQTPRTLALDQLFITSVHVGLTAWCASSTTINFGSAILPSRTALRTGSLQLGLTSSVMGWPGRICPCLIPKEVRNRTDLVDDLLAVCQDQDRVAPRRCLHRDVARTQRSCRPPWAERTAPGDIA